MKHNVKHLHRTFGAIAALAATALPVSAALWFASPAPSAHQIDLSVYDQMPRVGEAQLASDPFCDRSDVVAVSLTEDYAEQLALLALNDDQTRFDFWASDASGTWTATYTRADGVSCVIGSGMGWTAGASPEAFLTKAGVSL